MGIFTKLLNVEDCIKTIERLLRTNGDAREIKNKLEKIKNYMDYFESKHERSVSPDEIAILDSVKKKIADLEELPYDEKAFDEMIKEFQKAYNSTNIYLLRHPEKPKKGQISQWGAMQAIQKLEMSRAGVKQARIFAKYLCEEVILCPKPVRVTFYCSEVARTKLFAEIIKRELLRLSRIYNKQIITADIAENPALAFRFTKEAVMEMDTEYKKGEYEAFKAWIGGKYRLPPDPRQIAHELNNWVHQNQNRNSKDEWNIVIGVSHSFIIDTLLHYKIGHGEIIKTADYVRFVGDKLCYDGRWHNL